MKNIKAILLAAGDSTRLHPVGDKLFLNFNGTALIQYMIIMLKKKGIRDFIVVASGENELKCRSLGSLNNDINLNVVKQKNDLGMAGAVLAAKEQLDKRPVLIINPSDVFEDYLLDDFESLYKKNPDAVMAGKILEGHRDLLGFLDVEEGSVKGIVEKPGLSGTGSKIAGLVLDYFKDSPLLIEAIEKTSSKKDDLYETAKDNLIKKGLVIKLLSYNGYWGFLKYPWHVLGINSYFLARLKSGPTKARIDKSVRISGNVVIEDDVTILENVKLVGPLYIGRGVLIGQNCLIRESTIGERSIVGYSTEISRSYLGSNCWFHHNYIGDSVIMDNTAFGFGAVVANYRLDGLSVSSMVSGKKVTTARTKMGVIVGKNSRIGVNASLMPGVSIGRHSFVGSGVVLSRDLPDDMFISCTNSGYKISSNRTRLTGDSIDSNRSRLKF